MNKKILTAVFAVTAALACAAGTTGCAAPHSHTYEAGYTFDKLNHWHASDCGHAEETEGTAAHDLNENGCTVCGFKYTQGLEYSFSSYRNEYTVKGIGTATGTQIIIPAEYNGYPVTSVDYQAFKDCTQITRVIFPDSVTLLGEYVFENCVNLLSVELPANLTMLYRGLFDGCTSLTQVELPEGLTHIGDDVFDRSGITEIYIPKNVFQVDYRAFKESNIEKITVDPANPYNKGDGNCVVFTYNDEYTLCAGLKTSVIPDYVKSIGNGAFSDCTGLAAIEIPASVKTISWNAFMNCKDLETVTLHKTLTEINGRAFANCPKLKDIYFDGTVGEWNAIKKCTETQYNSPWNYGTDNYTVHCTDGAAK